MLVCPSPRNCSGDTEIGTNAIGESLSEISVDAAQKIHRWGLWKGKQTWRLDNGACRPVAMSGSDGSEWG